MIEKDILIELIKDNYDVYTHSKYASTSIWEIYGEGSCYSLAYHKAEGTYDYFYIKYDDGEIALHVDIYTLERSTILIDVKNKFLAYADIGLQDRANLIKLLDKIDRLLLPYKLDKELKNNKEENKKGVVKI